MIALGPTVARVEIRAPRGDVWNFLVEADHRNAWWPELQLGSEIHTRVSERWTESAGDTFRDQRRIWGNRCVGARPRSWIHLERRR